MRALGCRGFRLGTLRFGHAPNVVRPMVVQDICRRRSGDNFIAQNVLLQIRETKMGAKKGEERNGAGKQHTHPVLADVAAEGDRVPVPAQPPTPRKHQRPPARAAASQRRVPRKHFIAPRYARPAGGGAATWSIKAVVPRIISPPPVHARKLTSIHVRRKSGRGNRLVAAV